MDAVVKKIPSPRRELNPRTPIVRPVAQRYTEASCGSLAGRPRRRWEDDIKIDIHKTEFEGVD
jgi:hypothetical protein